MRANLATTAMLLCLLSTFATAKEPVPPDYGAPPTSWDAFKYAAETEVRSRLIDPESARFRWPFGTAKRDWKPIFSIRVTGYFTCGLINSKNKMGGYSGEAFFIVTYHDGRLVDIDIGQDGEVTSASVFCGEALKKGLLPPAPIMAQLSELAPKAPRLGAGFSVAPDGLYIGQVTPGSAADLAHLRQGMVIEAVNGIPLKGVSLTTAITIIRSAPGPLRLSIIGVGDITVTKSPPTPTD